MDIADIKPGERILEIVHPKTSANLGIRVSLLSISDDRMKKIRRQIMDRRLALERRGKGFTSEQIEENNNLLLFTAMTGWSWGVPTDENGNPVPGAEPATFKGSKPDFNQKNVFAVFEELEWFRDQIDNEVGDTTAFFR